MDVSSGVLVDWVVGSGLTQSECALIQPTYEFYFYGAEKERARIQKHLLAVEAKLRKQTAKSLGEVLRVALDRKIDAKKLTANHSAALLDALVHKEANVRIGAAHALGRLRIDEPRVRKALIARLEDSHREVRFWAAAALLETLDIPRPRRSSVDSPDIPQEPHRRRSCRPSSACSSMATKSSAFLRSPASACWPVAP